VNEPIPLADAVATVAQALAASGTRYPVVRTRYNEERAPIPADVRRKVYHRDHFRCVVCGRKWPEVNLNLDHVIPWSAGGSDEPENLRTVCTEHNQERENCFWPIDLAAAERAKYQATIDACPLCDDAGWRDTLGGRITCDHRAVTHA